MDLLPIAMRVATISGEVLQLPVSIRGHFTDTETDAEYTYQIRKVDFDPESKIVHLDVSYKINAPAFPGGSMGGAADIRLKISFTYGDSGSESIHSVSIDGRKFQPGQANATICKSLGLCENVSSGEQFGVDAWAIFSDYLKQIDPEFNPYEYGSPGFTSPALDFKIVNNKIV
mgnify:CR=1 FL=1